MSIFQRTLLLMSAALVIAVAIGTTLINTRPPMRNMPVLLSEIAEMLLSGANRLPPVEGYSPPAEWPRRPPQTEWRLSVRDTMPQGLANEDAGRSEPLRYELARLAGRSPDQAFLSVPATRRDDRGVERPFGSGPPRPFGPDGQGRGVRLGEGYIAALRDADGRWRVLESVPRSLFGDFGRQVLLLVGLGIALLAPLAWWFARQLSAPVRQFAQAAQRLGADAHAAPLDGSGPAEMRAAADAFNAMQDRINHLVAERTQMIGAIAHDLRTPLTRLAFRLEGLPQPLAGKVEADIAEMNAMISAALDFIRERSLRGQRERLDFRLLVERIVDDRSDLGHDVTLQRGAPVTLLGDPVALRRLVSNLVDNALKYGERARLAVSADSGRCRLVVDDDGPGVPTALQERVFDPFFRAEGSRNRETGGIGLGLTTVRAIATDHGGDVRLENRVEGGLRVTVTLPQAD